MAHPYNSIREDKVAKSRVAKISRASGGGVHSDEAADKSLVKSMVKRTALKMEGGAAMARGDRPNRASGGRVKKTSKGTTVNVIVAPTGGAEQPQPSPAAAAPPPVPPMPSSPPPGLAPSAMMLPPGAGPMPPRSAGGRAYKRGGAVSDASQGKTPVQPSNAKQVVKDNMNRKPVITKAKGGKITGGARGGLARLQKEGKA